MPTKIVGAKKIKRTYTPESLCAMDIATSVNKIGEIINLSQELNTLMWHLINSENKTIDDITELYCDIAQLDVMSNIEIDSAKKEYPVDNVQELRAIKAKYARVDNAGKRIMPGFFAPVSRKKGYYNPDKKTYLSHDTTMDYLQVAMREFRKTRESKKYIPFVDILKADYANLSKCNFEQVDRVLDLVQATKDEISAVWSDPTISDNCEKYRLVDEVRQKCIDYIGSIRFNGTTMFMLLSMIEEEKYKSISRTLFAILFGAPNLSFFEILDDSRQPRDVLVEDKNGYIHIYDLSFVKQKIPQKLGDF